MSSQVAQGSIKAIISLAVLFTSLYIILFRPHDEAARQWAVGAVAFILGYYFRESESHVPHQSVGPLGGISHLPGELPDIR